MISGSCCHPLFSLTSPFTLKHLTAHPPFGRSQCLLLGPCGVTATFGQTHHLQLSVSSLLSPGPLIDYLPEADADLKNRPRTRRLWEKEGEYMKFLPLNMNVNICHFTFFLLHFFSPILIRNCSSEKCLCSFIYFHLPINKQRGVWLSAVGDTCWAPWTDPQTAHAEGHSRGIAPHPSEGIKPWLRGGFRTSIQ